MNIKPMFVLLLVGVEILRLLFLKMCMSFLCVTIPKENGQDDQKKTTPTLKIDLKGAEEKR